MIDLWDRCDLAVASRLAEPEVLAALAAARRNGRVDPVEYDRSQRRWGGYWAAMRPIELDARIGVDAGHLAAGHALGGADAVHLASALSLGVEGLVFAAWDRRLRDGAAAAGLERAPADV